MGSIEWLVNDRAGKNRARPNRAGSAIFTKDSAGGSAEPQDKKANYFGTKIRYFLVVKIKVLFTIYLHMSIHLLHSFRS